MAKEKCYCECMKCDHHYIKEETGRCACQYGHITKDNKPKKCISYED